MSDCSQKTRQVTIIYYHENSLELYSHIGEFSENSQGRVVLPESFKEDKSIIAVCDGEVCILNKIGDRIVAHSQSR